VSTFIIRIVSTRSGGVRGRAEHVRSGESEAFSSKELLWGFLERMAAGDAGSAADPDDGFAGEGGSKSPARRGRRG
jgi:hypothetical protein